MGTRAGTAPGTAGTGATADEASGHTGPGRSDGHAVISVRGLTKRYGDVEAVRGIDFEVSRGETFGFLGPNGAGKTTTIKILCTLANPTSGSARVAGYDVVLPLPKLEDFYMPTVERIKKAMEEVMKY